MDVANASALAEPLVYASEGCALVAFLDRLATVPVWTIGHGTTHIHGQPVYARQTCTRAEADRWAIADMAGTANYILKVVRHPLTDHQLGAMISFVYNIGAGHFATSTVLEALNAALYQRAADNLLDYDQAGGRPYPGLLLRRQHERIMFMTGMGEAEPHPAVPPSLGSRHPPASAPHVSADDLNQTEIERLAAPPPAAL